MVHDYQARVLWEAVGQILARGCSRSVLESVEASVTLVFVDQQVEVLDSKTGIQSPFFLGIE